ncbi:phospholipase D-like domain-containing protein [Halobaculum litoreum]|uniref:Phospholipase D-like domain-containing protein n=1 Tax=Halobaculum litoreum TaxID=3031998 RepID=A0ABD5XSR8_9EURY
MGRDRRRGTLVLLLVVASAAVVGGAATAGATSADGATATDAAPRVVALLPNPVAAGDAGEYVRLRLPRGNWTLSDGEDRIRIERGRAGAVLVTDDPEAIVAPPNGSVVAAPLSLSNAGERLVLRRGGPDGTVVDEVAYADAPEGERWLRDADGGDRWRPVGYAPRDPVALGAANATAFVLPDAPGAAVEPIRRAEDRVLLAGYTFASERVADDLIAARERGVRVRVLLDGAPVGGITDVQARLLDRLVDAGVDVRVVSGPHARFRYHHAKYAVADDAAVVSTENWKPSGTGGADNRGGAWCSGRRRRPTPSRSCSPPTVAGATPSRGGRSAPAGRSRTRSRRPAATPAGTRRRRSASSARRC